MSLEGVPDINKVRNEKISQITKTVDECCSNHLNQWYDNLVVYWTKKDDLRNFAFTVGGVSYLKEENSVQALNELYEILLNEVAPELPDYQIVRTTTGIELRKNTRL